MGEILCDIPRINPVPMFLSFKFAHYPCWDTQHQAELARVSEGLVEKDAAVGEAVLETPGCAAARGESWAGERVVKSENAECCCGRRVALVLG